MWILPSQFLVSCFGLFMHMSWTTHKLYVISIISNRKTEWSFISFLSLRIVLCLIFIIQVLPANYSIRSEEMPHRTTVSWVLAWQINNICSTLMETVKAHSMTRIGIEEFIWHETAIHGPSCKYTSRHWFEFQDLIMLYVDNGLWQEW